MFNIR